MKKRGKDDGIKSRHKSSPPRFKTLWLRNDRDVQRIFVKEADKPNSALKQGARNMAEAFPQSNEEVLKHNPIPEPKGKKAKVLQFPSGSKPSGTIGRVRMDHPPDRNIQVLIQREKDWHRKMTCLVAEDKLYLPASEADARVTIELRTHYSGKAGHWRDPEYRQSVEEVTECASPTTTKPTSTHKSVSTGYGFAYKKPEIKTGLTPSGKPITDFLAGGKYAPKVQAVTSSLDEPYIGVRWFRNNVPPEYMPDLVHEYEELEREHSRMMVDYQFEVEELYESLSQKQEYIEELEATVKEQDNELADMQQEINLRDWENAHGQNTATNKQAPPLKKVATLFTLYKKLYEDNPLRSFLRERGYSYELEKPLHDYFTMQMEQRARLTPEIRALHRIAEKARVYKPKCTAHKVMRELKALRKIGVTTGNNNHLNVKQEKRVFHKWTTRNTLPMCTERINYVQWWQDTLTSEKLAELEYKASPAQVELRNLKASKYYKPARAIVKGWHDFKHVMTKERQTPWDKAKADKLAKEKAKQAKLEQRKLSKLQHKKQQQLTERQKLRKAMAIAY